MKEFKPELSCLQARKKNQISHNKFPSVGREKGVHRKGRGKKAKPEKMR